MKGLRYFCQQRIVEAQYQVLGRGFKLFYLGLECRRYLSKSLPRSGKGCKDEHDFKIIEDYKKSRKIAI